MWLNFCHIRWFLYFFLDLMVSSLYCAVPTSHVTILLSHSVVPLFIHTFDGAVLTLCCTMVTYDCTFVTFYGSFIFFSHFMVLSSYCVVPTSHMTILLSHSVVLLFFLTFDGTALKLCRFNITCDCTIITFHSSFIFPHIWWYHPHIIQVQYYMRLYFYHIPSFPFFFSNLMVSSTHYAILRSIITILLWHSAVFFLFFSHIQWYYLHIV